MLNFNDLLQQNNIDPADVILLRHTGSKGKLGVTPYELWAAHDGSFDRYQSTQLAGRLIFGAPIWASFVSNVAKETVFVGLYSAAQGDPSQIDWKCPMSGLPPGKDKGVKADFYRLKALDTLCEYQGKLRIDWGSGFRTWVRRARRGSYPIVD